MSFKPAWWLPGGHLQTLYPYLARHHRPPRLRRERLELPDGDFIDIDWGPEHDSPLIILLHGLEGSIRSHYAAGLMRSFHRERFATLLMNFRGCSGEPNRLARSYHSGDTGDFAHVLRLLHERQPRRAVFAIGISLGGNVLLKWLGENPAQRLVQKAAAVSVPFELNKTALRLEHGLSKIYQFYLLRKLQRSTRAKARLQDLPIDIDKLGELNSFRAFDDRVTAPLHGFSGVDDYYRRASSRQYLKRIQTPTLILHACDDPFMTPDVIPDPEELGPGIDLEISRSGGHVGFISGAWPCSGRYWLDQRLCRFFASP